VTTAGQPAEVRSGGRRFVRWTAGTLSVLYRSMVILLLLCIALGVALILRYTQQAELRTLAQATCNAKYGTCTLVAVDNGLHWFRTPQGDLCFSTLAFPFGYSYREGGGGC